MPDIEHTLLRVYFQNGRYAGFYPFEAEYSPLPRSELRPLEGTFLYRSSLQKVFDALTYGLGFHVWLS